MSTDSLGKMYIDGQWCESSDGKRVPVVNPATEETIREMTYGTQADVKRALEAASRAMKTWMKQTAWDRAKVLKKTADLMRERADSLARTITMEQGKPVPEAKGEVLASADTFEWFAEEGKRAYGQVIPNSVPGKRHMTIKHPVGVVGGIGPWNFPIMLQARKIAPALAVGCTIVCKPAPSTPLSLIALFECLIDAGVPAGVANFVTGDAEMIGQEFLTNRICRKISFTGSTKVGKLLMRGAADQVKRLSLELGGHAPFIVFPDADPEVVAKAAVRGKFRNNGQVCISPSRFFVHEKIAARFTEVAIETARSLKLGNGLDSGTEIGPMFEKRAMDNAINLIGDATQRGATVLTGGKRCSTFDRGYFFEPTILRDLPPDAKVLTDEPFAPVMPILDFSKIEDVIAQANNTPYGLAAYVFTNDLSVSWKMAEGLEAGIIGINDPVPATTQCPFGGMKESGYGRELAHEGLEAYLETKYVSMQLRDA
ncbi:NAD-dependent succinate-semialdehyde dehydrogenase [Tuwongella immobilis]|uniref:Aldehyde dehydrogenase domain-containing protein n=1 Tax=Tuwongella immobilis TaxID=692036 RepID=A0A6C2YGP0_9BACT|nr:NAD-dependent succinate-semialdehyde dehydrogenase [Tuwongella immobilis]VIP00668.1 succinate-semialdehyde dehydrogenase : NAD-dependent aldehyde dehydrogenase OS=Singulisphaera acidiphila (strain ATCC BAA-1392 / DSM 18658 / VKM B-2454 / MOB10) GN=Sinac_1922 PE=3 SV=1: Aldedh [Tuwongella immobilis]VTR96754.1 succinate-semialdehyde dehydrogenase : NAD-dependent aldehyde dehydrogenase OS=Singulisphaera acidiphila (strain ATCC BAA-1392 / DSM 18658 / VKM B-2454 / MOB10) GN=Sinac_1922 PE=3 SV=1: Al